MPTVAVICLVYNEELLLPHFLDWYSSQVDAIYIIDNQSTDRSREIAGQYKKVILSTYETGGYNDIEAARQALIRARASFVGKYSHVMFPDCDEFIISKKGRTIKEEIQAARMPEVMGTEGYNMWPKAGEPSYDPKVSLFKQFTWGIYNRTWTSKPVIIKPESPLKFIAGNHSFLKQDELNKRLKDAKLSKFYLLHYAALSEDMYVARRMTRVQRLAPDSRAAGVARHYYDKTEKDFSLEFRNASSSQKMVKLDIRVP